MLASSVTAKWGRHPSRIGLITMSAAMRAQLEDMPAAAAERADVVSIVRGGGPPADGAVGGAATALDWVRAGTHLTRSMSSENSAHWQARHHLRSGGSGDGSCGVGEPDPGAQLARSTTHVSAQSARNLHAHGCECFATACSAHHAVASSSFRRRRIACSQRGRRV